MLSLFTTVAAYSAACFAGMSGGFVVSSSVPSGKSGRQITSFAMEFSSGFTVSVIFLSLIPVSYNLCTATATASALITGVLFAMILQERLKYSVKTMPEKQRLSATWKLSAVGAAICGAVRGLAAGTGFGLSPGLGSDLCAAAAISAFPDGTAVLMMLKTSGASPAKRLLAALLLSLPFSVGAAVGAFLGDTDDGMLSLLLSFSGGVMLYSAVGDMCIESKLMYHGRFIPVFNIAGMMCGTLLILAV